MNSVKKKKEIRVLDQPLRTSRCFRIPSLQAGELDDSVEKKKKQKEEIRVLDQPNVEDFLV